MRIALVLPGREPTWQSCKPIIENLRAAYRCLDALCLEVTVNPETSPKAVQKSADKIRSFRPDFVVFLDYVAASHVELLKQMRLSYSNRPNLPSLFFHIFGNFTLEPHSWLAIDESIRRQPALFLCASTRQTSLVRSFLPAHAKRNVVTCPFAVNPDAFYYNVAERQRARRAFGWKNNEFIFLYAGRMTQQKNVVLLLDQLLNRSPRIGKSFRVALAGAFDWIESPLFEGRPAVSASYESRYLSFLSSLPKSKRNRVQYLGPVSHQQIRGVYNAADCLVSWSTYHDEDFGMTAAEALCTGLPSLLTDWGGYSDFGAASPRNCWLTPVRIRASGIKIDGKKFSEHSEQMVRKRQALAQARRVWANAFSQQYSPQAIAMRLQRFLSSTAPVFPGFNQKLTIHSHLIGSDFSGQIYKSPTLQDEYYFSNYSHYTGQT